MKHRAWLCLTGWLWCGVVQAQPLQAQLPSVNVTQLLKLQSIRSTPQGLLLLINGNPDVRMERIVDPDRIVIDLATTAIPKELHRAVIPINQFGIRQARIAQFQKDITRIVLDFLPGQAPTQDWQSRFDPRSGLILQPPLDSTSAAAPVVPVTPGLPSPVRSVVATLQGFTVQGTTRVVIQADQPTTFTGTNDPRSNTYNLVISPARLSPTWEKSILASNVPIERVRVTQVNESVVASFKLSPGWQVQEGSGGTFNQILLQLTRSGAALSRPTTPVVIPPPPLAPAVPPVSSLPDRGKGVVVVDPGHGGRDPGALGNGIQEKEVVMPISQYVGRALQRLGYVVHYTRTQDVEIDLEPRVQLAERVQANAFISIHANSLESRLSHVSGVETYHAPGATQGGLLAEAVHSQVIAATGARDRGVRSARFHVIRRTSMPSILVETGFVTNAQEASNLSNPAYQERLGEAIAKGVHQFLSRR